MARIFGRAGKLAGIAAIGLLVSAGFARAQIGPITSRAALGADDFLDWGTINLGQPPGTPPPSGSSVPNPITVQSNGGLATIVSKSAAGSGNFVFFIEGTTSFKSNFSPGDNLLNTSPNDSSPMTMAFKQPVRGAGAQIATGGSGTFTARITAFDSGNIQLASFTEKGFSSTSNDGTAIFLGIMDSIPDIKSVQFSIDSFPGPTSTDYTVNGLSITTSAAVPEPSSFALLGVAAIGWVRYWRRRWGTGADLAGGGNSSTAAV